MMDDELRAKFDRFNFMVEDAKRDFGRWDLCDPVVWAILRLVRAQSDFAHAIDQAATYGVNERGRSGHERPPQRRRRPCRRCSNTSGVGSNDYR